MTDTVLGNPTSELQGLWLGYRPGLCVAWTCGSMDLERCVSGLTVAGLTSWLPPGLGRIVQVTLGAGVVHTALSAVPEGWPKLLF